MCLLADEGQPKLGKLEDDTYVAIIPRILLDQTCQKCPEASIPATGFSSMCMEILARSKRHMVKLADVIDRKRNST